MAGVDSGKFYNLVATRFNHAGKSYLSKKSCQLSLPKSLYSFRKRPNEPISSNGSRNGEILTRNSANGNARGSESDLESEETENVSEVRVKGRLKLLEDFEHLKKGIPMLTEWGKAFKYITPLKVAKWAVTLFVAWQSLSLAIKLVQISALNPSFLMFLSWFLVFWPWPTVIGLAFWTLRIVARQRKSKAEVWEQIVLLTGSLTWLILVPFAVFVGYVERLHVGLFCLYFAFFCISAIVRFRTWGDLAPKQEDVQWKTKTSRLAQVSFVVSLVSAHWLAAFESVSAGTVPTLANKVAWFLLYSAFVLHWQASYFLGKYFDRLVAPKEVVVYGPYRFIRHPIYTSYILLFTGYTLALGSFLSLGIVTVACALYYRHRVKLEEDLLIEHFGVEYEEYKELTPHKFIPFIV